jgi:hypothetical protein
MNGHVFERYDESGDRTQFVKTLAALKAFAAKNLQPPEDLKKLFGDTIEQPEVPEPDDLPKEATKKEEFLWKTAMKEYSDRRKNLRSNLHTLYSVIWGQCSENVKTKIRSLDDYESKTQTDDCVWLLQEIKGVMHQFDTKQNGFFSALDARTALLTYKQEPTQTNADYFEQFKAYVDILEYYGGQVAEITSLLTESEFKNASVAVQEKAARNRTLAALFLRNADSGRFSSLLADLANQYSRGNNQYPTDLTAAYGLLVHYQVPVPAPATHSTEQGEATTSPVPATVTANSSSHNHSSASTSTPYSPSDSSSSACTPVDHNRSAFSLFQTGLSFTQVDSVPTYNIPPEWVLLDTQSTFSIFNNNNLVTNIRPSAEPLYAVSNGGYQTSHLVADVRNLGQVWYNPDSVANILSLAEVRRVCRITMDTQITPTITVHKLDGSQMIFVEQPDGLYAFDTRISPSNQGAHDTPSNSSPPPFSLLQTVKENKSWFTRREIEAADNARRLYRILGRPSQKKFEEILAQNIIINCPVTVDDAKRAVLIYGEDTATLKGKTTRSQPAPRIPDFRSVPIPAHIFTHHKDITLCADFFFVQGQPFLHTISRKLQYRTIHPVDNRHSDTMHRHLSRVIEQYKKRGFVVTTVLADVEFECLRNILLPIQLETVPPEEHIGEVERSVRTIKERVRATAHGLPFKKLPRVILKEMVIFAVQCLNQLPADNGLSNTLSPNSIMTGKPNPDYNNLRLQFGSYAQVYEPGDITINNMRSRTTGAIALTTTGNSQGQMKFMSLASGKIITRGKWTELPMPEEAIFRIEQLATNDGRPLIQSSRLIVEWRPNAPFDDDDDPDYLFPGSEDDEDLVYDDAVSEVSISDTVGFDTPTVDTESQSPLESLEPSVVDDVGEQTADDEDQSQEEDNLSVIDEQEEEEESTDDLEESAPATEHGYNLRPSRERTYAHRLDHQMDNSTGTVSYEPSLGLFQQRGVSRVITGLVMTQMSAAAGIRRFGQPAWNALLKEFQQLHDKKVFTPRKLESLSHEERKGALRAVNLIKEKNNGQLKGRIAQTGASNEICTIKTKHHPQPCPMTH